MWRHIEADDFSREPSRILWMRFLSKMIRVVEAHLRHSHHCSLGVQSRRARNRQNKRSTQSTRASKKTWKKGSLSSKADTKIPSQKFFFHLPYLVGSIEVEVLRVGSCVFGTRFMRCRSVLTARSPDWQCLLGTFLFGAWYPAWWSDAERQDDWRPRIGSKTRFRRMSKIWPTKNHNTLASSDWTFQSVSWPLHCSAKTNDFLMRIFVALLWTFLLVHGTIFLDRWLAGGGDDAFNTLLDFGEWSFCSFPQYTTYIYTLWVVIYVILTPRALFSWCQCGRFFSETGAGKHVPRCVMVDLEPTVTQMCLSKAFFESTWEHIACPCFPCLHWTTDVSTWVLENRWSMKFALVHTASCSILSNWSLERKTPPTILPGGITPSARRLWILSWTGSASWQIIALVAPLCFGYNFGLNFHLGFNAANNIKQHHICKRRKYEM